MRQCRTCEMSHTHTQQSSVTCGSLAYMYFANTVIWWKLRYNVSGSIYQMVHWIIKSSCVFPLCICWFFYGSIELSNFVLWSWSTLGYIVTCCLRAQSYLTLNSIHGPFRPESNFAYTQHSYLADVTLKTLCILQPRLTEWRKPIKILKRKSRVTLYRS